MFALYTRDRGRLDIIDYYDSAGEAFEAGISSAWEDDGHGQMFVIDDSTGQLILSMATQVRQHNDQLIWRVVNHQTGHQAEYGYLPLPVCYGAVLLGASSDTFPDVIIDDDVIRWNHEARTGARHATAV